MKKYIYLFTVAALATSCTTKLPRIIFTGKAQGLTDAVFIVTDAQGKNVAGQNITDGTFKVDTVFEGPAGYGTLGINKNGEKKKEFEVYLEAAEYTVETNATHPDDYPKITSTSGIQNELTTYYSIQDEVERKAQDKVVVLGQGQAEIADNNNKLDAFKQFVKKTPNSLAAPHIMMNLKYEQNLEAYYDLFQKLSPTAKQTEEGEFLETKFSEMMKLLPGKDAPLIAGTTPDGKKFDKAALDKKVYILDFWKAGNQVSRLNHQDMIGGVTKNLNMAKVGIISVSLDNKRDWWTKAIEGDKMNWPQYSDLKGDESANATAWAITRIPTYYILNGKWQVVARDVSYSKLEYTVNQYLQGK